MFKKSEKALVVFSGGQDSTTLLAYVANRYDSLELVTFFYGQKHSTEIEQAKKIIDLMRVKYPGKEFNHQVIDISFFGQIADSALTSNGDVTKPHPRIANLPASYVPNRNAMFLTISHAVAQKTGCGVVFTGVCETDFSGYPDCRDQFIKSLDVALGTGSECYIPIITPLMWLNKAQTWELAVKEGAFELVKNYSHTCYNGSDIMNEWGRGCDGCPACKLRREGFEKYMKGDY